ncbi:hypothetical protein [Brumimicrobium aurantiacum]|uniref:Uncharacterized protein n=1 Tax=Brumimicrobium aurantiacum TaxID=1737063 RepID=A0A3E1EY71_9FLAO|nr:hypothetical protein [Brumimicrobium aurantiacum]RFC54423.1 hypothetical protein DXU93_08340 [Brumimicrobium aurantiacum]
MKQIKLINAISEAIIPLLGIFFFDWGLYFILLFYFIDLIATEVFIYLKVQKIVQFQKIKFPFSTRFGRLIINSVLALILIILSHLTVYFIVPNIDFASAFIEFLSYEEAGIPIPQGYILLPLVVLTNFQQYKTTFIQSGVYRVTSWKDLIFSRRKALYIAILGAVIAMLIASFIAMPESIYVMLIVAVKIWVDLK